MSEGRFANFGQPQRGVEATAQLLQRLYLVERETMRALGGWHMAVSNWELKMLMPRHWWHDSLHANALRQRVLELRYPRRDVDSRHDPRLVEFLGQLTRAQTDAEFALGIYQVVKPALVAAYQEYRDSADLLADAPSIHQIAHILIDEQADLEAAAPVLAALPGEQLAAAQPWVEYLQTYLSAIGGMLGDRAAAPPAGHQCAGRPAYTVPARAQRDPRFLPAVVESPRRPPRNVRERQVWYAIDHANEIWAAEVPGAMIWQWPNMPWEFYMDAARWGYDEQRHAEMGIRRLSAWGFEAGVDYPMVGDPYHAILEQGHDLLMVMALLYYFERDAPKFKQQAKESYAALGDTASAHDSDYDWADEAIHLRYGYTWLQHILGAEAKERMPALVNQAGELWERWLEERWSRGEDGYGRFMERIEARIAAAEAEAA
ncbi:MAG TPA: DUF455 family protein [Roseiflexaceae bacterium]|nr:DUF455 family protein [Roseiflexaceae bacterium]